LRAEGFSCSLDGLFGGLGISKLQVLAVFFLFKFLVIKTMLDPDPDSLEMLDLDPDPHNCLEFYVMALSNLEFFSIKN
jgi:hypothetical protein